MKRAIATVGVLCFIVSACGHSDDGTSQSSSSSSSAKPQATYRDPSGSYSFTYGPELLTLTKKDDSVMLSHANGYPHPDPCDFKDGRTIPSLTDFSVMFKMDSHSLLDTIAQQLHWTDQDLTHYVSDGELMTQKGFIEPVKAGAFSGYSIEQGVEGCGNTIYFLQKDEGHTLVITRKKITEFSDVLGSAAEEYKKLPGVIAPEQEEDLFEGIMDSLK